MSFDPDTQQKKHSELEGTPDPFPSLGDPIPVSSRPAARTGNRQELDTDSHDAFPTLAPSAATANKPAASAWGSAPGGGGGPRIKPTVVQHPQATESFTLTAIDLSSAGRDGKPMTLGDIMKQVMNKFKVKIEASTNQRTKQTTFHLKADSKKELEKGKRNLVSLLSPVVSEEYNVLWRGFDAFSQVSLVVNAPASTISTIIGPKG